LQRIIKFRNETHFLLSNNLDDPKITRLINYFKPSRLILLKTPESLAGDEEQFKSKLEPSINISIREFSTDSILEIAMDLMKMVVLELLDTGNKISFNFSNPAKELDIAAFICSQFAYLSGYKSVSDSGNVEKIEYLPLLPLVKISDDQFGILSILVTASEFKWNDLIDAINSSNKREKLWRFIFPMLSDYGEKSVDDMFKKIKKRAIRINKESYINSLDDLVMILNPGIKKPGKKYNSERARLTYHIQKIQGINFITTKKNKRQIIIKASWTGIMYFLGSIIQRLNALIEEDESP